MGETIQGFSSLNAYKAANNFIQKFDHRLDSYLNCLYLQFNMNRWLEIWLILSGSSILALLGILIVKEKETFTMALTGLILTYAIQIVDGINYTVRLFSALETSMVALERVIEYTNAKPEAAWKTDSLLPLPINWPSKGQIKFINYSTTYRDGLDLVLKNINLTFEPKSKIGVVGRTGAGKSSLILSLFRIIEPKKGSIVIDDVDITKIGLKDLRSKLTIIPQVTDSSKLILLFT
jgi:multidrug resistance protein, putative (fragment)